MSFKDDISEAKSKELNYFHKANEDFADDIIESNTECWNCHQDIPMGKKYCKLHCGHHAEDFDDFTGKCKGCGTSLNVNMMMTMPSAEAKATEAKIERSDGSMTIDGKQVIKIWESMQGWYWYAVEDQGEYTGVGADGNDIQAHAWFGYVQADFNEWGTFDSKELERAGVWTVPKSNWGWTGKMEESKASEARKLNARQKKLIEEWVGSMSSPPMVITSDDLPYSLLSELRDINDFDGFESAIMRYASDLGNKQAMQGSNPYMHSSNYGSFESKASEGHIWGDWFSDNFKEVYTMDQSGTYRCKHCDAWFDMYMHSQEVAKYHLAGHGILTESKASEDRDWDGRSDLEKLERDQELSKQFWNKSSTLNEIPDSYYKESKANEGSIECPNCDGIGYFSTTADKCERCDGKGTISDWERNDPETGEPVPVGYSWTPDGAVKNESVASESDIMEWITLWDNPEPTTGKLKSFLKSKGYSDEEIDNVISQHDLKSHYGEAKASEDDLDWTKDKPEGGIPFYCPLCHMTIEENATWDGVFDHNKQIHNMTDENAEILAKGFTYSNSPPTSFESKASEYDDLFGRYNLAWSTLSLDEKKAILRELQNESGISFDYDSTAIDSHMNRLAQKNLIELGNSYDIEKIKSKLGYLLGESKADESTQIYAELIRFSANDGLDGGRPWALVSQGKNKDVTRDEGLQLKNKYNMDSTKTGYSGYIDESEFGIGESEDVFMYDGTGDSDGVGYWWDFELPVDEMKHEQLSSILGIDQYKAWAFMTSAEQERVKNYKLNRMMTNEAQLMKEINDGWEFSVIDHGYGGGNMGNSPDVGLLEVGIFSPDTGDINGQKSAVQGYMTQEDVDGLLSTFRTDPAIAFRSIGGEWTFAGQQGLEYQSDTARDD